jgi:hypothetical protein
MVLKEQRQYDKFWGVDNIAVYKLGNGNIECTLGNFPKCDYIRLKNKELSTLGGAKNFISLCYKETSLGENYDKCEVAILFIDEREIPK